ncbi:MAG: RNA-binding transcriptional accessory protein [Candidatus Omnitrophica bacterium]|nr:RNA-binding transcriptional accessory protein [Candidatus Omnitrophota bacterium]
MSTKHIFQISSELNLPSSRVEATVRLLDEGGTVPFISRYRKEATGSLDEVAITAIRDRLKQLRELDKRREAILASLQERKLLTDELKKKILEALTLTALEDIYLPFRPKRRTRATIAKEKGLEPLAEIIFKQGPLDLGKEARKYINAEKEIGGVEEALAGARDIIAEWISEDAEVRSELRKLYFEKGIFKSKVIRNKEVEGAKYKDYFDWQDPVKTVPSHRLLAVRRGEKDKILSLKVEVPENDALHILQERFLRGKSESSEQVQMAIQDTFRRLLAPSMETEVRAMTKEQADHEAIKVFAENLRQLLMAPPLGQRNIMAIDPGYRTGCKVVCLNHEGKLLYNTAIFPSEPGPRLEEATALLKELCQRFKIEFIAIGNGTASRETEDFVRSLGLPGDIQILIASETGASVYSASDVAREELPDYDVTVRGAVSIGRRLMDPLAELVKIDAKAIGVGQYQHDVDQKWLKESLDDVVVSCVNQVGVELNTASKQLLTYVAGLGPTRAQSIIDYRNQKGAFKSREELYDVPHLGSTAIQQAAGFLRIRDGVNILDASAVHPESYGIVENMAKDVGCAIQDLMRDEKLRRKIELKKYVTATIGIPTLEDIYQELAKPGRDPRDNFEIIRFKEGVTRPEDLTPGMKLPAVVTNITNFGVFVDLGVHLDGLIHISQISDKFIKHPSEVLKMHQHIKVTVLEVDLPRRRIALTMKNK